MGVVVTAVMKPGKQCAQASAGSTDLGALSTNLVGAPKKLELGLADQ
jgi:hypothetical protein